MIFSVKKIKTVSLFMVLAVLAVVVIAGCGVYTFSGSTLPKHLKTVNIPVFGNQSLQPDVAEALTTKLNKAIMEGNLLRIIGENGDATISGKVIGYSHKPYTYGSQGYRNVTVSQYSVSLRVEIEFMDNVKKESLYKGVLSADGIYELATENELKGMERALDIIVEQTLQNSVRSW